MPPTFLGNRTTLRSPVLIIACGLFLAFMSAVGTMLATWSSREIALREWENRLTSVSRMLSAHASQTIGAADLALRNIADNINEARVSDAQEFRWAFGSRSGHDMLRESAKGLRQIDVITIVGGDGAVVNSSRAFPSPPIDLSDRDYFQAHVAEPSLEFFLSKPVQNRGNGEWSFYLARKIRSPSGEMLGLVLTGLHTDFFSKFYASVGLGLERISLLRDDGILIARHSDQDSSPGGLPEKKAVLDGLLEKKHGAFLMADGQPAQAGFDEMVAFEIGERLPIAVSVAASRQQVLREWEREAAKFVLEGGTMTAFLIAATMILARLVRQLEAARNTALSAVEEKTRFASNVSHELRTPMNAIIGGGHQLLQTPLPPEARKFAGIVTSAAQQLMALINDILDFSYYEARNFRIEPAPFGVRDMAQSVTDMMQSLAQDSSLELTCKISDRTPAMLLGDSGRICQVLLNLLGNAVKYTDRGSVALNVDYVDGSLVLCVADTGRGISDADSQRIFQPFERGHVGSDRPGTGLGLTISKKLVEAMSGTIHLSSAIGWGSRFTITLPMPESSHPALQGAHEETAHARRLDILVAEDVAPSRVLLTSMLEKMGHKVVAVENGHQAVETAKAMTFDLILMDLQMPELDGASATRRIREMACGSADAHIIAVSANVDLNAGAGLTAAGFDDTLLKPVTPARLDFMIARIAAA